jgi:hypothetical protein
VKNSDILTINASNKSSSSQETNKGANSSPSEEHDITTHTIVSAVLQITLEDFWMMPCGMWKGPNQFLSSLADIKLTCTGWHPKHEVFANDFDIVMTNLNKIFASV